MTLELPNSTGRLFRSSANKARIDLAQNFAGESEPSPALEGMLWLDTLNNELKYCFQVTQSATRWITILKTDGNTATFELPLGSSSYPDQALPEEISSGTVTSARSYSVKDIKDAVVTHSPIFQDGASGIYIQRFTPRNPVSGRFWFNDQTNTLAIYNGSRWVTLGSFGGEEPAFSLRGPTAQLETGNLSMLTTGSDSVERLWSAKVLKDGIDAISPKLPALVSVSTLAAGVGRSAVSISPYVFRQAVIRVAQSSTAGLSLSISDFANQGTIPKLVTGSTMNSILRHESTGLTLARMRDSSSTILGLVSGSLLSSYRAGLGAVSTTQDRIVYRSTSVRCSSSANRIYFNVSGSQVAYISSTGFWVRGVKRSSSTTGGSVGSLKVQAAVWQWSSSFMGGWRDSYKTFSFYRAQNVARLYRDSGLGFAYSFTRSIRITSSTRVAVNLEWRRGRAWETDGTGAWLTDGRDSDFFGFFPTSTISIPYYGGIGRSVYGANTKRNRGGSRYYGTAYGIWIARKTNGLSFGSLSIAPQFIIAG